MVLGGGRIYYPSLGTTATPDIIPKLDKDGRVLVGRGLRYLTIPGQPSLDLFEPGVIASPAQCVTQR